MKNLLAGESACPTWTKDVGQAISPANSDVFNGVTMDLRPAKGDEDALLRTHSCVPCSHSCEHKAGGKRRSHECERGTLRSVRHDGAQSLQRIVKQSRQRTTSLGGRFRLV